MHSIVCPTCFTSDAHETEVINYSKPRQVGESYLRGKKHKSSRLPPALRNRHGATENPSLWSLKLLIRRVFGGGDGGDGGGVHNRNAQCYRTKNKVHVVDVERKHKIMKRDVVRARRTAYGMRDVMKNAYNVIE